MRIYHCRQKLLLRFANHGGRFIKDYSTNVLRAPQNAFVDAKGKIVAMFDQHIVNDDEVWAVIERSAESQLLSHLKKYIFITDVRVTAEDAVRVYWDLDNEAEPGEGDVFIPQRAGRLWLSRSKVTPTVTEEEMTKFRVTNGIPWQGVDFNDEMILTVEDEERVSYLKGCYLGQELVARVHYRGRPPKKLTVKMLRDCSSEQRKTMTSRVTDPSSGEIIGFVFEPS